MKMKTFKIWLVGLFLVFSLFIIIQPVQAAWSLMDGPSSSCRESGDCELNDFMKVFTQIYAMIFGVVGSITLLMFVVGGVMFLTSGGSQDKITKGKNVIVSSIVGLAIVFGSFMIIDYVLKALGYVK